MITLSFDYLWKIRVKKMNYSMTANRFLVWWSKGTYPWHAIQSDMYLSRLPCGLGGEAIDVISIALCPFFPLSLRTACSRIFLSNQGCMLCNERGLL